MAPSLITIDIGNSRIKLGRFDESTELVPQPSSVLELDASGVLEATIENWLDEFGDKVFYWAIASVNRPACGRICDWIDRKRIGESRQILSFRETGLRIDLPQPAEIGIDRLLAAVAANRLRGHARPIVVADVGTAITVDAISTDGVFLGGAILPGIRMAARALEQQTDLLPDIEMIQLGEAPEVVGKSTTAAIQSGLFWGAVGSIRELVSRYGKSLGSEPQILLTGGAAPPVARLLGDDAMFEPHLVLAGIALAVQENLGAKT